MARSSLTELAKRVAGSRDLARRSLGIVQGSLDYLQAFRAGKAPGPLLLAVRAANELAEQILQQPTPVPTPAQRRILHTCAAQIRALTGTIIVSTDARDPNSLESELGGLVQRTLALIERVTAEAPQITVEQRARPTQIERPDGQPKLPGAHSEDD